MTTTEMDVRKMAIIRFLINEATPDKLKIFENTRILLTDDQNDSESSSELKEPAMPYQPEKSDSPTWINTRKLEFFRYLLNEVEEEELLIEYEVLCQEKDPPCMYTVEEMKENLRQAIDEIERGEFVPHEEVLKIIEGWE